jgi:hypothetical protein
MRSSILQFVQKQRENDIKEFIRAFGLLLIEVAKDLATSVTATGLLVVNNTLRSRQHNDTKLTGRQKLVHPLFHISDLHVVAGRDSTALVQTAVQGNDDLARAMVINDFKVVNVAVLLHDLEELDNDLGAGADENLTLATALSIGNALKSIAQHAYTGHL